MASFDNVTKTGLKKIKKYGFKEEKPKSKHEEIRLSGSCSIILYKTGKLLVQGKKENTAEAEKLLLFTGAIKKEKSRPMSVGSDETLKGDTFGGIVVAAFMADDTIRKELKGLGVKDSKKLLKPQIVKLGEELIGRYPKNYHVESLYPREYNAMIAKNNTTKLLDNLHLKCYNKLSKKAIHIVDLYPGCSVGDIREKNADSKYPEVSAASIIARYFALIQIRELEHKAGFFIPFGSTNVESGLLELKKKSLDPADYVKMNFSNVISFFR
ncbi:TPA: hypothetical protein HA239_05995 [Candidatus Woesearchaeota archaeon]|nr:Ribonuclease [archaeon GW2011_AR15]MBS3104241.1 hypothetical protein [Candidatus Woesearchaeota archaeon]HIH41928.1 hypothetical protein [Candidatus Woesearchaeota archaeon]